MSFINQEEIITFLKSASTLTLSTSINGLPSSTLVNYKLEQEEQGDGTIIIQVSENTVECNQLLFNKNCCLMSNTENKQIKIYGKAELLRTNTNYDNITEPNAQEKKFKIVPEKIVFVQNNKQKEYLNTSNMHLKTVKSNIATEFKFWFKITRAPFFTATIMPILLGLVLAWNLNNSFSIITGVLTLIAGILIHSGTNLANDFFDQRTDVLNENFTPFNGGSRTIQLRLATQEKILLSAITSFVLGISIVLWFVYKSKSIELFLLLVLGIFLAYFYTAGPLKLSHHGLGEVSNFLGYGPILTLSAWIIQVNKNYSMTDFYTVLYWSFVPGLLLTLILIINEFQDFDSDKLAGKKTLVVRIGKEKGRIFYVLVSFLTYFIILVGIIGTPSQSFFVLFSLAGILFIRQITKILKENLNKIDELLPANGLTVKNHLLTNLLLILGFIVTKLVI